MFYQQKYNFFLSDFSIINEYTSVFIVLTTIYENVLACGHRTPNFRPQIYTNYTNIFLSFMHTAISPKKVIFIYIYTYI